MAAPYHFVPVKPELAAADSPVLHDVAQTGEEYWSGELHCTMTALTPLLAANYQFNYEHLDPKLQQAYMELLKRRGVQEEEKAELSKKLAEKKVLEPLTLPASGSQGDSPGSVVISGAAIKGMVRHSVQALLSAPMERVQERTFSFRPNIQIPKPQQNEILPALVIGGGGWEEQGNKPRGVKVLLLKHLSDVIYVHPNVNGALPQRIRDLAAMPPEERSKLYADEKSRNALKLIQKEASDILRHANVARSNILKPGTGQSKPLQGLLPAVNLNGLDFKALLHQKFCEAHPNDPAMRTRSPKGYHFLLLSLPGKAQISTISGECLRRYYDTLEHLSDADQGHLLSYPGLTRDEKDNISKSIKEFLRRGVLPGDLLFVELASSKLTRDRTLRIVTLGHHFYYRYRYRDSIHTSGEQSYQSKVASGQRHSLRAILCPLGIEQELADSGAPKQLSAARLLFGYVTTTRREYDSRQPLSFAIGKGDFEQLAGRVAINMAVEHEAQKPLEGRFLNAQHKCLVPLRPLGSPKPSAVEMYLTQDRLDRRNDAGTLCTYGDTWDDKSAGQLRGRKFYLHQPDASVDPKCYELVSKGQPDWQDQPEHLLGDQAALARFVSRPGAKFRFTVRFRDLRAWELGALLFALAGDEHWLGQLLAALRSQGIEAPEKLQSWLGKIDSWKPSDARPLLAHKLGHGRPLGLGSVQIAIEHAFRLHFDRVALGDSEEAVSPKVEKVKVDLDAYRTTLLDALAKKLKDTLGVEKVTQWMADVLLPWLQIHRYAGREHLDYPRDTARKKDPSPTKCPPEPATIFNYHSKQRKYHAAGRKQAKSSQVKSEPMGLKSLDELDS